LPYGALDAGDEQLAATGAHRAVRQVRRRMLNEASAGDDLHRLRPNLQNAGLLWTGSANRI
jgi:hypothetical protein